MKVKPLKVLMVLAWGLTTINSTIMAQKEKKYKEIKIQASSEIINVPADSLWNIIKQFDNVGTFFTGIDHAEGRGKPEFEGAKFQPEFETDKWKKSYDLNAIRRFETV